MPLASHSDKTNKRLDYYYNVTMRCKFCCDMCGHGWVRHKKVLKFIRLHNGMLFNSDVCFTTSRLLCHYIRYIRQNCLILATECWFFKNFVLCHFHKQGGVCMKVPRGLSRQMFQSILTFQFFNGVISTQ